MSIEDQNTVDFLAIERDDAKIVLAISDHWDWSVPMEHVLALQEKMNSYAEFVESGQVWESATEKSGRTILPGSIPIEIKVFLKHGPPPLFFEFLDRAREVFEERSTKERSTRWTLGDRWCPGSEGLGRAGSGVHGGEIRRWVGLFPLEMEGRRHHSRGGVQSWTSPGERLRGRDAGVGRNGAPVLGWYGGLGASDRPERPWREVGVQFA
jgi:hypothetical protein